MPIGFAEADEHMAVHLPRAEHLAGIANHGPVLVPAETRSAGRHVTAVGAEQLFGGRIEAYADRVDAYLVELLHPASGQRRRGDEDPQWRADLGADTPGDIAGIAKAIGWVTMEMHRRVRSSWWWAVGSTTASVSTSGHSTLTKDLSS